MTVEEIFEDLKALKSYFETAFCTGELDCLEVRLRKFKDEYSLLWGDPQYDTDHRGQWSYGCITVDQDDETLAIMAADMLRELKEGE